jgi:hypothetical protein
MLSASISTISDLSGTSNNTASILLLPQSVKLGDAVCRPTSLHVTEERSRWRLGRERGTWWARRDQRRRRTACWLAFFDEGGLGIQAEGPTVLTYVSGQPSPRC